MTVLFNDFRKTYNALGEEMENAIKSVLQSGSYILGNNVIDFEKQYSLFCGTSFCAGVANGLDALSIALKSLGIKKGDEVIIPSNTYVATVLAISSVQATPVFIEPRYDTYNIDPSLIEEKITFLTRVIMPVHLYGQACEMDKISEIALRHNIRIVEDNAQAQGAACRGTITGAWGDINATSFYPTKNLGAIGDAGAITTNNEGLYQYSKLMRNYGSQEKYYNEIAGVNSRLDEIQAALLLVKLRYLATWNERREELAKLYSALLSNVGDIQLPKIADGCTSVWHLFVIRSSHRDKLITYLKAKNISTSIHYPVPPHLQKAYQYLNYKKGDFSIAENLADTVLSLPLYPEMTNEQVFYIVDNIKKYFDNQ